MKRSRSRRVTGWALFGLLSLLIVSRFVSEAQRKVSVETGVRVLKWAGLAEKKKTADSKWSPVREGETLDQGDQVRTQSNGQMSLLLEGRGRLELSQDSVAHIEMTASGLRVRVSQGVVDLFPEVPKAVVAPTKLALAAPQSHKVRNVVEKPKAREPAAVLPVRPVTGETATLYARGSACERRDVLEDLSTKSRVSDAEIEKAVLLVKKQILRWFEKVPTFFDRSAFLAMESRVAEARVVWGSTTQEAEDGNADLEFSSGGALIEDPVQGDFVRLGDRFGVMLEENPARAHLELTRLTMLMISPCVLKREGYNRAWDRLLVCLLGKTTAELCTKGSEAEAAWAVSTAVAVDLSGASCLLPAQERERAAQCLGKAFEVKR